MSGLGSIQVQAHIPDLLAASISEAAFLNEEGEPGYWDSPVRLIV